MLLLRGCCFREEVGKIMLSLKGGYYSREARFGERIYRRAVDKTSLTEYAPVLTCSPLVSALLVRLSGWTVIRIKIALMLTIDYYLI